MLVVINNMKLYPILFEAATPPPLPRRGPPPLPARTPIDIGKKKSFTSYTPPDFGLSVIDDGGGTNFGLIHMPSLQAFLLSGKQGPAQEDIFQYCAAMISAREGSDECLGAAEVGLVAASPNWKGAGITMYGLVSNYFGSPITSDRRHSSSVAARETWAKIEGNSEWAKAGVGLDNYAPDSKIYVDIQGSYPSRKVSRRSQPKTKEEIDDCPLPTKGGSIKEPEKMAELVGSADAYKYNGPLSAQSLIANFDDMISKMQNPMNVNIKDLIYESIAQLFQLRYQGSETTR